MSGTLMLINPKKRRKSKKPRTAAQRAATKRMIAANRSKRSTKRRRNPVGLARVSKSSTTSYKRRRRNPSSLMKPGKLGEMVITGLKGAAGSVAINAAVSYLPAQLSTGKVIYATRAGLALLIGTFGRKLLGRHARVVAEGALTVNFADLINSTAGAALPGSTLHGVNGVGKYLSMYQNPPTPAIQRKMNSVGEYVS